MYLKIVNEKCFNQLEIDSFDPTDISNSNIWIVVYLYVYSGDQRTVVGYQTLSSSWL